MASIIDTKPSRPAPGAIGVTGLPVYGGYVWDEWLTDLQSVQGRKVYREMADNDAIIGACLLLIEMVLRQTKWTVEAADDSPEAEKQREFFDGAMFKDMRNTWTDVLAEALSFLPYGWCLLELVYKRRNGGTGSNYDDGLVGWADWAIRGQETLLRWEFQYDGTPKAMIQLGPPDYATHVIPLEKALLLRTTVKRGNPEGRSVMRNAYRSWYFLKHIQTIEGIGIERDLAGLPVLGVPVERMDPNAPSYDQSWLAQMQTVVTNIRRDENEGIIKPIAYDEQGKELYTLELLSTGGSRQFDTDKIVNRYQRDMSLALLSDFILMGHEQVGTQALGSTKADMFATALGAWADVIAGQGDVAIRRLGKLNGFDPLKNPTLAHGRIAHSDVVQMSTMLQNLTNAGIQIDTRPDGQLVRHILEEADMPAPQPGDVEAMTQFAHQQADQAHQQQLELVKAKGMGQQDDSPGGGKASGGGKSPLHRPKIAA